MAAGWLKLLGTVPWGEVIGSAPKVADGARKLWGAVAGRTAPPHAAAPTASPAAAADASAAASEDDALAALRRRVAATEAASAELHGQMLAGSELIQALAEQNTRLVAGIDAIRGRLRRLTIALAVLGAVAAAALVAAGVGLAR